MLALPKISSRVRWAGLFLLLGTCGAQILRTTTAPPVTAPLEKDAAKSKRTAVSRVGGEDLHAPLPATGDWVAGNGVVEPAQRETQLAAQVTAVVKHVAVKEGDQVKEGDLLVQLDNGVELGALAAAESEEASERAAYTKTLQGLRIEDRDAVAAETEAAKAKAELAVGLLARTEKLNASGAATQEDLERARRQAQVEGATYTATAARFKAAERGSRREDIAAAKARFGAAQARVRQAQAALDRLAIRAPIAGEILQVKIREGELYSFQRADPLIILGDTRILRVRMDVDERDIARLSMGAKAYVLADAFKDVRFPGKVVEIGRRFGRKNVRTDEPTERIDTKILEVVIELESNAQLVPGQRVVSYVSGT